MNSLDSDGSTLLYGGTYDPPHEGHIDMCVDASQTYPIRCVQVVPARQNPLKTWAPVSPQDRVDMLHAAMKDRFSIPAGVLEYELKQEGPSYTINTVRHAQETFRSRIALLMGTDTFAQLEQWREPAQLLRMAHIIVAQRPGFDECDYADLMQKVGLEGIRVVNNRIFHTNDTAWVDACQLTTLDTSSSDLRKEIATKWETDDLATPPQYIAKPVWDIIVPRGLYRVKGD